MTFYSRVVICVALLSLAGACTMSSTTRDLREIDRTSAPNDALACPPGVCKAEVDIESPLFAIRPERLREIVRRVISSQARTEIVEEHADREQLVFVQRSRLFGFRDTIWIETVDLDPHASVIIYSRSNVGFWDLGVNLRRVRAWLAAVEAAAIAKTEQSRSGRARRSKGIG